MAWTTAITTLSGQHTFVRGDGRILTCFVLTATSDASGSGDLTLSTELTATYGAGKAEQLMQKVRGSSVHYVNYYAGTATTEALITVDDQEGLIQFTDTVATAANDEGFAGTGGPLIDAIIAVGTLANTKTAVIHFWFIK